MASKKLDGAPGFECKDCGCLDSVDAAGEAPYPRACRVCGGPNFRAINGHDPRGTTAAAGSTVTVGVDDATSVSDKA